MAAPDVREVVTVDVLRRLFRNLLNWVSMYETDGIDTITDPSGVEWSLWDLLFWYQQVPLLPRGHAMAIDLFLVQNLLESDAAVLMGVSPTNPIGKYASEGLAKLVRMIEEDDFLTAQQERPEVTTTTIAPAGVARCRGCQREWPWGASGTTMHDAIRWVRAHGAKGCDEDQQATQTILSEVA